MNGFLSARKLKNSREFWLRAVQACSPPNDQEAAVQADNKTTRYNMQASFVADMDQLLASKCNYPPMTPILNQ